MCFFVHLITCCIHDCVLHISCTRQCTYNKNRNIITYIYHIICFLFEIYNKPFSVILLILVNEIIFHYDSQNFYKTYISIYLPWMFFPVPYWFLRCMGGLWPVFEACVGGPTGCSDRLHDFSVTIFLQLLAFHWLFSLVWNESDEKKLPEKILKTCSKLKYWNVKFIC